MLNSLYFDIFLKIILAVSKIVRTFALAMLKVGLSKAE